MRLINADDITINLPDTLDGDQLTQIFIMVKDSIDKLPTIDAIPVEWLKGWSLFHYAKYEIDNDFILKVQYRPVISEAIEDYKKERND